MSIASEITRLQTAKADIKTAIEAKGVTVPANAKLDDYDTYVASIPTGGGTNTLNETLEKTKTSLTLTDIGNATSLPPRLFMNNTNLTSIQLPSTANFAIGDRCFSGCTNLTGALVFPQRSVTDEYTYLNGGYQFEGTGITSLTLRDVAFQAQGREYCQYTFQNCINLTSITLGKGISNINSNSGTFKGCTSLTTINFDIPLDQTGYFISWASAFDGCTSLTTFTSPSNVSFYGNSIFAGCTSLTTVTFGKSDIIRRYSFYNTALTDLYLPDNSNVCGLDQPDTIFPTNATPVNVHVPASLLTAYQDNPNWASLVTNNKITFVAI